MYSHIWVHLKIILLLLASILGKAIGINGIWWNFLISETVTVILAIIYLGIAENMFYFYYRKLK